MKSDKLGKSLMNLKKATDRFAEALQEPESSIVMDATIQRFEFTYELMWENAENFLRGYPWHQSGLPETRFQGSLFPFDYRTGGCFFRNDSIQKFTVSHL